MPRGRRTATPLAAASIALALLLTLAAPLAAWAKGPVEATFRADTGPMEIGIVWSAVPAPGQDLPPEAWAMQEPVYGPITELFLPGTYEVTGDGGDTVFFGRVVIKRKGPNDFVIPVSAELSPAGEDSFEEGHACPGPQHCPIDDPSGLAFVLPAGWTSDMPFLAETAGGAVAAQPTVTLTGPGGHQVLVLNPLRWIEGNGTCTDSPAGPLCIFGPPDGVSLAGLAVILPSLSYSPQ
jgi:Ca-activated chloride channel family protein